MFELFQYGFVVRAFEAGVIVALLAPLVGIFLVLRRYSLVADTFARVSLAGVAVGLLLNVNPIITAVGATLLASFGIERLRFSKRVYGESALALFLSGSLALALILISFGRGFTTNLFTYLFGSILTVTQNDVYIIGALAAVVAVLVAAFYKELVFISFDEEAAQVSGVRVKIINVGLIILTALVVALAIPVVGVLLISALIVIPVVAALQLRKSFRGTLIYAEVFSVFSVIVGIILSFYLNTATSGTIVMIMLACFGATYLLARVRS